MSKKPRRPAAKIQEAQAAAIGQALARSPHRAVEASDLVSRALTVSDLAEALAPIAPDVAGTIQRIRHWTREGVLQPIAFAHSGPGKHRRYSPAAIYSAAVLHVLTIAGLPVSQSQFLTQLMQWSNEFAMQWITARDKALIVKSGRLTVAVTAKGEIRVERRGPTDADAPDVVLAIALDLAKIFTQVDVAAGRIRERQAQQALKPRV
jgi:DNA-binding transcriptional MerR regulator